MNCSFLPTWLEVMETLYPNDLTSQLCPLGMCIHLSSKYTVESLEKTQKLWKKKINHSCCFSKHLGALISISYVYIGYTNNDKFISALQRAVHISMCTRGAYSLQPLAPPQSHTIIMHLYSTIIFRTVVLRILKHSHQSLSQQSLHSISSILFIWLCRILQYCMKNNLLWMYRSVSH